MSKRFIEYVATAPDATVYPIVTNFNTVPAGSGKWYGGVLAPNGMIYGVPYSATTVLKINPTDDTFTTFGSLPSTSFKWRGGVLAPNGMIYCAPLSSGNILKINPTNDTTSTITTGAGSYNGGVLAPNGHIYFIPDSSTSIIKINPTTDTVSTVVSGLGAENKWGCAILAPNGIIYAFPNFASTSVNANYGILRINPANDTVTHLFANTISNNPAVRCATLAANGKAYGSNSTQSTTTPIIFEFDPTTETYNNVGNLLAAGTEMFSAVSTAVTNKIYFCPRTAGTINWYDYTNNTVVKTTQGAIASSKFSGFVLARNGSMYAIPDSATTLMKMRVSGIRPDVLDTLIPSDLSTLATSKYNRYYNKCF